jgi:hypothetical protein
MTKDGSKPDRQLRPTDAMSLHIAGNSLFDRASFAVGLDAQPTRELLLYALQTIRVSPREVTRDDLLSVMSIIEERLTLIARPEIAIPAIGRLRKLLSELTED